MGKLNLYLITRHDDMTYGDCCAMIVCAESESEASKMKPYAGGWYGEYSWKEYKGPAPTVEFIGIYQGSETLPGCILADWNDG